MPASEGGYGKGQVRIWGPEGDKAAHDLDVRLGLPPDTFWFDRSAKVQRKHG